MRAIDAPGFDGTSVRYLRESNSTIVTAIQLIVQGSLELHHFPSQWKSAKVIPAPKLDRDTQSAKYYRPISLLSVLGKVDESIVKNRLTYWFESGRTLYSEQYRFKGQKSAEAALWRFISAVSLVLKQRRQLWVASLDLRSAYDKIWHSGLLVRMARIGIPRYLILWTASFLDARTVTLCVGNAETLGRMNSGVPQGSPLSPILFMVFLDQILKEVSGLTNIQAFADDILLWIRVDRHHFNSQKLSLALQKLEVRAKQ